jgi:hypothetical protein
MSNLFRGAIFKSAGYLAVTLLLLAGTSPTPAQKIVHSTQAPCEENSAWLDLLMQRVNGSEKPERVFVIARLGNGEHNSRLSQRRLHNARMYLGYRLKPDTVILAEGERANGEGRVEFYVGSELVLTSMVRRGADLCVSCFDGLNPKYYGCGRKDARKRSR